MKTTTKPTRIDAITDFREWCEAKMNRRPGTLKHKGPRAKPRDKTRRHVAIAAAMDIFDATGQEIAEAFGFKSKLTAGDAREKCHESHGNGGLHQCKLDLVKAWNRRGK